jgi:hypothetical protein
MGPKAQERVSIAKKKKKNKNEAAHRTIIDTAAMAERKHSSHGSKKSATSSRRSASAGKTERKRNDKDGDCCDSELETFRGSWYFTSQSIGGVSGNTGFSQGVLGQVKVNGKGVGVGSLRGAEYGGAIGTPLTDLSAKILLEILDFDPNTGTAKIRVTEQLAGAPGIVRLNVNIIAVPDSRGQPFKIVGVDTAIVPADPAVKVSGVNTFFAERLGNFR